MRKMVSGLRRLITAWIAIFLPLSSFSAHAEFHASVTLATDSLYRGLSQTQGEAAIQGSMEYQFESGVYLGVWASRSNYIIGVTQNASCNYTGYSKQCPRVENSLDHPDMESDLFLGFYTDLSHNYGLDLAIIRHRYHGPDQVIDYDWNEVLAGLHIHHQWLLSAAFSSRWLDHKERSGNLEITYLYPLPYAVSLNATAGVQIAKEIANGHFTYTELGLSKSFAALSVLFAYSTTDNTARNLFGDRAGDQWFASISWSF